MSFAEDRYHAGLPVAVGPSDLEGGGDCLRALRSFEPGEVIMEDPAFVFMPVDGKPAKEAHQWFADSGQQEKVLSTDVGRSLFRGNPGCVNEKEYRRWINKMFVGESEDAKHAALQVMLLFAFNAYMSSNTPAVLSTRHVVYPVISKANHSCACNATVITKDNGVGQVLCVKPIQIDDEITVSYLTDNDLSKPTSWRQRRLRRGWDFLCCCKRCELETDNSRSFVCPCEGCGGRCFGLRGEVGPLTPHDTPPGSPILSTRALSEDLVELATPIERSGVLNCESCGLQPSPADVESWGDLEVKVETLMGTLPKGLYSAWAACEEFTVAHPEHWLSGQWRRHIALHTENEANDEEDPSEAAALRSEALAYQEESMRCVERLIGRPMVIYAH